MGGCEGRGGEGRGGDGGEGMEGMGWREGRGGKRGEERRSGWEWGWEWGWGKPRKAAVNTKYLLKYISNKKSFILCVSVSIIIHTSVVFLRQVIGLESF